VRSVTVGHHWASILQPHRNLVKHLFSLALLLVAFAINFSHQDGWKDGQAPGDEPAYVERAYSIWNSAAAPQPLTWSPGYEVLMSPFVGIFGKEQGYKIWRFVVFGSMSLLAYFAFARTLNSIWFGLVLGIYTQLFFEPYISPALQSVECLLILLCLFLLGFGTRYLGLVFGILLNCILITGAALSLITSFSALCLLFYARKLWSRQCILQLLLGVGVFAFFIHHYSYDLREYPAEASFRGRAGLYHQLSLYILRSGRSAPYLKPGENDPTRGVDEYHRNLFAIDRYYLANWGATEAELRSQTHDRRWPSFLLDWPWMMRKDPQLMKEYRLEVMRNLRASFGLAFQIVFPFGEFPPHSRPLIRSFYFLGLVILLMAPWSIRPIRRRMPFSTVAWPSRLQFIFLLSSLSILVPLILVMPLEIYFPPLTPCFLMICALAGTAGIRILEMRFQRSSLNSAKMPSPVGVTPPTTHRTQARTKRARTRI
jgi:hypothetical protein